MAETLITCKKCGKQFPKYRKRLVCLECQPYRGKVFAPPELVYPVKPAKDPEEAILADEDEELEELEDNIVTDEDLVGHAADLGTESHLKATRKVRKPRPLSQIISSLEAIITNLTGIVKDLEDWDIQYDALDSEKAKILSNPADAIGLSLTDQRALSVILRKLNLKSD